MASCSVAGTSDVEGNSRSRAPSTRAMSSGSRSERDLIVVVRALPREGDALQLAVCDEARGAIAEPLRDLLIDGLVAALVADLERRAVLQPDEPTGAGR